MSRSRCCTSWSTIFTSTKYHPVSPEEQRELVSTDQMPEKLSKIMERTAQFFFLQTAPTHASRKGKVRTSDGNMKFLKENPSRYPTGCGLFSSCITWSELDETGQHAGEADCTWHITFARGSTKREVMSHMYHAFPIFQKEIEAQAPEDSYRNLSTRATRGAYNAVMRSPIEEFVKSEDIDINGDKPTSGVSHQMVDQFSAELYKKAKERVVKEIVDIRERIAENLKDQAKTQEELPERHPEQLLEKYDNPWGSPGERQRSSADKKGKGKGKGKPKNKLKGKGQGTATNRGQTKSSGNGKKNTSKGRGSGTGMKGAKNGGKTEGKSKGQKPSTTR